MKKTKPITIGATIEPKMIPNLYHTKLNGVKILEFNKARVKKIREIIIDHNLKFSPLKIGQKPIIKNTTKKTRPKFRLELILIFDFTDII